MMQKAVPLDHELISDEPKEISIWFGCSLNEKTIWNTMKNATKSCIDDCKELGIPFFTRATPDKIPQTRAAGYSEKKEVGEDEDD